MSSTDYLAFVKCPTCGHQFKAWASMLDNGGVLCPQDGEPVTLQQVQVDDLHPALAPPERGRGGSSPVDSA